MFQLAFAAGFGYPVSQIPYVWQFADSEADNRRSIYSRIRPHPPHFQPSTRSYSMSAIHEPTTGEVVALFRSVEETFPKKTLGEDKWYLPVVS